jgi:hypothetical protein
VGDEPVDQDLDAAARGWEVRGEHERLHRDPFPPK